MNIKDISEEIHENALAKGFWNEDNLYQKLLLIISEVTEAMEADRKGKYCKASVKAVTGWLNDEDFIISFETGIKDTFEDEMADTVIRIFDLCRKKGIDLEAHIQAKHRYNTTRPHLHGKKY